VIAHHGKQRFQIFYKEVIILKDTKDSEIQHDIGRTHNLLLLPLAFITLQQKPTSITTQRCECNEQQKTPVPPSVEHVAGNDNQEILPTQLTESKPIEKKNYWKENQELERIEKHN